MHENLLSIIPKLRNHQFAEVYEQICNNLPVEESAPEDVAQAITSVNSFLNELKFLKVMKRKHPITGQIDELMQERYQYLLSIRGRVTYYLRSPMPNQRAAAATLDFWLQAYHEFFRNPTIDTQSRLVSDLSTDLSTSASLQEALEELDLLSTFDTLTSITSQMRELILLRVNELKAERLKAKLIRKTAYAHLTTLWKTLEVGISLNTITLAKCQPIFDSINWAISRFKAQHLSKTTRRENEKLKGEEPDTPTNPDPEPVEE